MSKATRVKLRVRSNGRSKAYSLTVLPAIGEVLAKKPDQLYFAELTDEGILFRPYRATEMPEWLK